MSTAPALAIGDPPSDVVEKLNAERPERSKSGKVYTFYSFKGGVGRSMALANIGVMAAREGRRVLMIDWDLEAPGLEHFFQPHDRELGDRLASTPGVIDLLQPERPGWRECVTSVTLRDVTIDIMHSGKASRPDENYTDQVQRLDWADLYDRHKIGTVLDAMREEWRRDYDLVFVDSRTGVTDIGDLCTVILPDRLVLLFVTNEQAIRGVESIYARALEAHARLPRHRAKLTALPVLSRDESYSEYERSNEWRERAADRLSHLFADWLPEGVTPHDAFQKIFVPYYAIWSFGEALPVVERPDAIANPASINAAYWRITRLILAEMDWSVLDELADPGELAQTRLRERQKTERLWIEQERRLASERESVERLRTEAAADLERARQDFRAERDKALRRSYGRQLTVLGGIGSLLAAGAIAYFMSLSADAEREIAALRDTLEAARLEAQAAVQERRTLQEQAAALNARTTELAARLAVVSDRVEATAGRLSGSVKEIQGLPLGAGERLAEPLSLAIEQVNALSREVVRLESDLENLSRDAGSSARFEELRTRLEACEAETTRLEGLIEELPRE